MVAAPATADVVAYDEDDVNLVSERRRMLDDEQVFAVVGPTFDLPFE